MVTTGKTIRRSAAALLIIATLLFSGCASIERMLAPGPKEEAAGRPAGEKTAGVLRPEKPDTLPPFENEYTREGFIKALVQFQEYSAMAESLQSYLWGDRIFEDRLATVAWLESGPYQAGRAVTLGVYDEEGMQHAEITRGLVREVPGKGRWWRFNYKSDDTSFTCEYFTDLNSVPRQILLKNNASGEKVSREPFYTEMLADSAPASGNEWESGSPKSGPPAWFDQLRQEEYQAQLNPLYAGMEILGEEAQLIDGRWIRAVHMRSGSGDSSVHAWFSPDVRGRLLRIKRSDDHVIAEVVDRISGYAAQLSQP
ncbi:MAG: hypothetical protein U5P10_12455 [Spirochaetia bacterium]|nr:hypothetical protein [Spirochaetia bacterium]